MADTGAGLLNAGKAAVDIIPRVDTAAMTAGIKGAATTAAAEFSGAFDAGLSAGLGKTGAGLSGLGTAFAPLSKAALGFGAVAVAAAENVDQAYHTIEQRTGATGEALSGLEGIANKTAVATGASFSQIAADESNLVQRLGASGPVLQGLTTQFENLKYVQKDQAASVDQVSSALSQFQIPASGAGHALDELLVASQKSGVGTNQLASELVSNGAIMRDLNLTYTQSLGLLGELGKAGIPVQQVMVGLRKSLGAAGKSGEDPGTFFADAVKQIKDLIDAGNDPKALGLAEKLFGVRGGAAGFDAIKQGKLDATDFTNAIAGANDTVNKTANSTQDFGRELGKVKDSVELSLKPLGDSILPKVEAGFRVVGDVVGGVAKVLGSTGLAPVVGDAVVIAASTSAVLKLGGALATVAGNRADDIAVIGGQRAAMAAVVEETAAATAAEESLATATAATATAQSELAAAEIAAAAGAGTTVAAEAALAEAEGAEAAAAAAATEANATLALAQEGVASAGLLASASLGTLATGAVAGVAAFAATTAGLHALEGAVNGPKVNVDQLTKSLTELAKHGDDTGPLATGYQNVAHSLKVLNESGFTQATFDRFAVDKAKDSIGALDTALANMVSSGHAKEAADSLTALAAANGLTVGEIGGQLTQYTDALSTANAAAFAGTDAADKHAHAIGLDGAAALQASNDLIAYADAANKTTTELLAIPTAQNAVTAAQLASSKALETLHDDQTTYQELLHGYPANSAEAVAAETGYQSALTASQDKVTAVKDAQQALIQTQAQGVDETHRLQEAVQSATDSLLSNQDQVFNARDALQKAIATGADHHEIEAKQRALDAALRAQASGNQKLVDAKDALTDQPAKQALAEEKASDAIVKAQKASADSFDKLGKAAHDLDLVLHGRPETDQKVIDAQAKLAPDLLAVSDANLKQVGSTIALSTQQDKFATMLNDPKNGTNAALADEVSWLQKIKTQSPQTKTALDPLITQLETIIWARNTLAAPPAGGAGGIDMTAWTRHGPGATPASPSWGPINPPGSLNSVDPNTGAPILLPPWQLPGHAKGGMLDEGWNLINEAGPELLHKAGSSVAVTTASQTSSGFGDIAGHLAELVDLTRQHLGATRSLVNAGGPPRVGSYVDPAQVAVSSGARFN